MPRSIAVSTQELRVWKLMSWGESNVVNAHSIVASRADKGGVLLALVPLLKGGWGKEVMPK